MARKQRYFFHTHSAMPNLQACSLRRVYLKGVCHLYHLYLRLLPYRFYQLLMLSFEHLVIMKIVRCNSYKALFEQNKMEISHSIFRANLLSLQEIKFHILDTSLHYFLPDTKQILLYYKELEG